MIRSWFLNILIILLSGLLLIDLIGGYALAQGEQTSVMVVYKGVLALTISIFLLRIKSFWFFIFPTLIFIILILFASYQSDSISNIGDKLALLFRFIFNSVVFIFLVSQLKLENGFGKRINFFIHFSFFVLVISILLGSFGVGNTTYSDSAVGSKGYFEGGNDIGVAFLVLGSYILFSLYLKKSLLLLRFSFILLFVIVALLASTKLVIIGSLISIIFIQWHFTKQNIIIKYIYLSLLFGILVTGVYMGIQFSGLMDRMITNMDKGDLIFVLLSGRDNTVLEGFDIFGKSTLITKFFGFQLIQNSEMDLFDILFNFGFVGVLYFCSLALIQMNELRKKINQGYSNASFGRFIFLLCGILGLLAGHTFFSTQGGLFLFSVVAMSYYIPHAYGK
jgi:hypothetical protein